MILDWIYNSPTWLWGTVVILALDAVACVGLMISHRLLRIEVRRAHNELTGFIVAVISVTYAVLLAFIAIATWESFAQAEDIVDREADAVGSIYRDTLGLSPAIGKEIRTDIREYTDTVVKQEWPVQQTGEVPAQGWEPLRRIHSAIVRIQPATAGEAVLEAELLRTLNTLYSARSSRLSAVGGHIPEVIWWVIFMGGALTTGYTYFFGFHDFRMHLLTTTAVSTSLALVMMLIIALDWPFRGRVSVTPDAFVTTEHSWNDLSFQAQGTPEVTGAMAAPGAADPRRRSK